MAGIVAGAAEEVELAEEDSSGEDEELAIRADRRLIGRTTVYKIGNKL